MDIINRHKPILDMEKTGRILRHYRILNDLSVKELQSYLGYDRPQVIYNWEQGRNMPSIDNLLALSALFGVTINDLIASVDNNLDEKPIHDKHHLGLTG